MPRSDIFLEYHEPSWLCWARDSAASVKVPGCFTKLKFDICSRITPKFDIHYTCIDELREILVIFKINLQWQRRATFSLQQASVNEWSLYCIKVGQKRFDMIICTPLKLCGRSHSWKQIREGKCENWASRRTPFQTLTINRTLDCPPEILPILPSAVF